MRRTSRSNECRCATPDGRETILLERIHLTAAGRGQRSGRRKNAFLTVRIVRGEFRGRSAAKLLARTEARRIAANIAKLRRDKERAFDAAIFHHDTRRGADRG